jgi:hypothetical protein
LSSYYHCSGVEKDLKRAKAGVRGEEGQTCGDAEPDLAYNVILEDGLCRQADEDLGDEALIEMNIDEALVDMNVNDEYIFELIHWDRSKLAVTQ